MKKRGIMMSLGNKKGVSYKAKRKSYKNYDIIALFPTFMYL